MPTATAFVDQVTTLNQRAIDAGKRLGSVCLDGQKKTVAAAISAGRKVREVIPV